jgi:hypothetical protein
VIAGQGVHTAKTSLAGVSLRHHPDGLEIVANGWCIAGEPVKSIEIVIGESRGRLPIWRPRPDMLSMLGSVAAYPPPNALCSGIQCQVQPTRFGQITGPSRSMSA